MVKNITSDIKYIGVDDLDLDLFESQYIIPNGMAYNSYLIEDEKIAVMDSVDGRKKDEWLAALAEALGERTPDYLIVQHMEPDHTGSVVAALERYPSLKVVTSARAVQMLPQFFEAFDFEGRVLAVKEGDALELGRHTLQFFAAPMVHWPEVIVTYDVADKVLFSADGFGKFGALSHDEEWACEARRYYFNICGKYGAQVQALLKKASALDIEIIAPLHGPVLTENLGYYIGLYDTWSRYDVETEGVFIACASIYGGTLEAAERLAEILREKGAPKVSVADLSRDDMAEAVEDAFRMSHLVVAAASYDGGMFPPMHDFLHHLKIKGYQRRRVGIIENGSWAPCAGRLMHEQLSQMKQVEIVEPMVTLWSRMKRSDEAALEALAEALLAK
ncbi:MAG: MBL fold metallo-hydrolase [Alistipes sp.]|nr:MBL fold metallo-hydrolase [Alistipes sp.]